MCRTECKAPAVAPTAPAAPATGGLDASDGNSVNVMSYNTEYTGYRDGRVPAFGEKIVEVSPDVVGLQECQDANALARASPGYTVLSGTGPQNYILYDNQRVEAMESGWWDITRDTYAQRTITWGKFKVRSSGNVFWFFNTHLPHPLGNAADTNTHSRIAQQLAEKRTELGAGSASTIVVCDCNPFASSGASNGSFESNLDARGISRIYMAGERNSQGGHRGLDKIFASDNDWTTVSAGDRGTGSSDHPAISAVLRFK
jgi:endonuclease/exonuclease/phosphatase family metal-dependent hydrolase